MDDIVPRMPRPGAGALGFDKDFDDGLIDDLAVEYTRLVVGRGPQVSPYASVHLEGDGALLWGPTTVWARRFMEGAGFTHRTKPELPVLGRGRPPSALPASLGEFVPGQTQNPLQSSLADQNPVPDTQRGPVSGQANSSSLYRTLRRADRTSSGGSTPCRDVTGLAELG